eukprot:CAMPEP_0194215926 /NCGR_PEP_ID=MMETSP0156-20130528/18058_1 /TAXON_ID=33649 /ORGANISM="Thalassionema nitzschioides, Strain L26-B" /LENGTH=119 /DNA_ID=CAMNT_0038944571 /DNA_START=769 /DNA_END=1128 /DNA_ORIENTATION=-
MEPKLKWLQRRLFWENNNELSNIIQKMPTLLGCSVQSNLEPTLDFCIEAIGIDKNVIEIIEQHPSILGYSLEKRLKPRLKEARKANMEIDKACFLRIAKSTEEEWDSNLKLQLRTTASM